MLPSLGSIALVAASRASSLGTLKRAALLFDHLAVATRWRPFQGRSGTVTWRLAAPRHLRAELDWLAENGLLMDASTRVVPDSPTDYHFAAQGGFWYSAMPPFQFTRISAGLSEVSALEGMSIVPAQHAEGMTLFARDGTHAPFQASKPREVGGSDSHSHVLEVVVNDMPQPDDATPWEDILAWRQDDAARAALVRLRRWIRAMAQEPAPTLVIRDELRYLMDEYTRHMRVHRLRLQHGALRALLTTGAGVTEGLLKLRLRTAVDALFSVRDRQLELETLEHQAPGREIAYLVHTRRRFDRS